MNSINVTLVRTNGQIDTSATLAQFSNELAVLAARESADLDTIAAAVEQVWADAPTVKSMNLTALASFTLRHLPNVEPSAHDEVTERIKNYVRGATDTLRIVRGKNGGVVRLDRLTAEELAKVEAQFAKAAAKRAAVAA